MAPLGIPRETPQRCKRLPTALQRAEGQSSRIVWRSRTKISRAPIRPMAEFTVPKGCAPPGSRARGQKLDPVRGTFEEGTMLLRGQQSSESVPCGDQRGIISHQCLEATHEVGGEP